MLNNIKVFLEQDERFQADQAKIYKSYTDGFPGGLTTCS